MMGLFFILVIKGLCDIFCMARKVAYEARHIAHINDANMSMNEMNFEAFFVGFFIKALPFYREYIQDLEKTNGKSYD